MKVTDLEAECRSLSEDALSCRAGLRPYYLAGSYHRWEEVLGEAEGSRWWEQCRERVVAAVVAPVAREVVQEVVQEALAEDSRYSPEERRSDTAAELDRGTCEGLRRPWQEGCFRDKGDSRHRQRQ